MAKEPIVRVMLRGLRLCCPQCGSKGVFERFWTLSRFCINCRLRFEREQGYFVGAIYINYAATVAIAIPGFFILDHLLHLSLAVQLILWGTFAALFPVFFFRYSKGLWLALGYLLSGRREA